MISLVGKEKKLHCFGKCILNLLGLACFRKNMEEERNCTEISFRLVSHGDVQYHSHQSGLATMTVVIMFEVPMNMPFKPLGKKNLLYSH